MHDAMADGEQCRTGQGLAQPMPERGHGAGDVGGIGGRQIAIDQHHAGGVLGLQVRLAADAVELTAQRAAQRVTGIDREQLELDAGRAGIDDEDMVRHGGQPATGCCSRLLCA